MNRTLDEVSRERLGVSDRVSEQSDDDDYDSSENETMNLPIQEHERTSVCATNTSWWRAGVESRAYHRFGHP